MEISIITDVRKLIQSGETKKALLYLKQQQLAANQRKTVDMLMSEWQSIEQHSINGTISEADKQVRVNQLHERLLHWLEYDEQVQAKRKKRMRAFWISFLIGFIITFSAAAWWSANKDQPSCPTFDTEKRNKVLLVPFQNLTESEASPHLVLRDRIHTLTAKHQLSTHVQLCEPVSGIDADRSRQLSEDCQANVVIWGSYSNRLDSIYLIMNYQFYDSLESTAFISQFGLRDVTYLSRGEMTRSLEEAILSLCGIIAIREDKLPIAKRWYDKLQQPIAEEKRIAKALASSVIEE